MVGVCFLQEIWGRLRDLAGPLTATQRSPASSLQTDSSAAAPPSDFAASCGASSVEGAPVAVVAGHESAGDEQDEVHEPPDAQSAQRQQLAYRRASVAQAEAVDTKAAQEEGVEQRGDKVVARVPGQDKSRASAQHSSANQV